MVFPSPISSPNRNLQGHMVFGKQYYDFTFDFLIDFEYHKRNTYVQQAIRVGEPSDFVSALLQGKVMEKPKQSEFSCGVYSMI